MSQSSKSFKLSSDRRALLEALLEAEGLDAPSQQRIPRRTDDDLIPLSFAQQRLWFFDQLEPGSPTYNIPAAIRLAGPLHLAALAHSLNAIVSRHETMRTTFAAAKGQAIQVIAPELQLALPLIDLSELPADTRESETQRLMDEEARQPFNLERGPLLRASVLRLGEREHILLLTMHHIISDGWSTGILVREVAQLYNAYTASQQSALPELPIQYADYAIWQRDWLKGDVFDKELGYWTNKLGGSLPVLELPGDFPRPAVQSFKGAQHSFHLSAELSTPLRALSRQEDSTLFQTMLTAFKVLLHRYTHQTDLLVGTPIANRQRAEIQGLIGFFVNTLVLRTDLTGNPSFREALRRVREVSLDAYVHQDMPFEKLVEVLQPERDLSHTPLFQVMFALEPSPLLNMDMAGLTPSQITTESGTAKFDLTMFLWDEADSIRGSIEYNTDLFAAATIARMVEHFITLLRSIVANPDGRIAELPLLTEAERQSLIGWNQTAADYPRDAVVHQLIEAQIECTPDAVAVVYEGDGLTYAELNTRANQLAHYLRAQGVGECAHSEMRVGLYLHRSIDLIIGLLGTLKAGGVYVPLDPAYPAERLQFMLQDSAPAVLLTESTLLASLPPHTAQVVVLDRDASVIDRQPTTTPANTVSPDDLAYMIYTSGSTGTPKGTLLAHRGLCNVVDAQRRTLSVQPGQTVLQFASPNFDASLFEMIMALGAGARLLLVPPALLLGEALVDLLREQEVAIVILTPSTLATLPPDPLPALHTITVVGEACPPVLVERWAPGRRFFNLYGPTEATIWTTYALCAAGQTPHIGRPIANTQVYILDNYGQLAPIGVPGELHIGGVGVGRGYHQRPDLTAEKFVPDQFSNIPGSRLYRTGDLARYLPDGNLMFLGRIDQQVKLRGFRIELGEIATILARHPSVDECVVVAREDQAAGALEAKRLVAYVVAEAQENRVPSGRTNEQTENQDAGRPLGMAPGTKNEEPEAEQRTENKENALTPLLLPEWEKGLENEGLTKNQGEDLPSVLRQYLKERLPEYMIPAAFVTLPALPKMPSGKIDRQALPAPDLQSVAETTFVAPRTPIEEGLAQIWADVLGIDRIGIRSNFFELGGHSLLATQAMARIRESFGVELPLRVIFAAPTIAALAERITTAQVTTPAPDEPVIPRVPRDQPLRAALSQERRFLVDRTLPDVPLRQVNNAYRLTGPLDVAALAWSLAHVVQRHEALRTTFHATPAGVFQVIAPALPVPLPLVDLRSLPPTQREAAARAQIVAAATQPFDRARGPLLRSTLYQLDVDTYVWDLSLDHIVCDGWSVRVLSHELAQLYQARIAGQADPLPPLPIQYADWASWQRERLQGWRRDRLLAYWRQQLGSSTTTADLTLPFAPPRPPRPSYRGATETQALSVELSTALRQRAQAAQVTLYMLFLAALQGLLHRYSGAAAISVASSTANRQTVASEALIGYLSHALILRTDLTGRPTLAALLGRVRELLLGVAAHDELPYAEVVRALEPAKYTQPAVAPIVAYDLVRWGDELALPGLAVERFAAHRSTNDPGFCVWVLNHPEAFRVVLSYECNWLAPTHAQRILRDFVTLLTAFSLHPHQRLADVPLPESG